ncbi:hypothetical protein K438DRAFT_1954180 [Mycena galopus ATCC 62051]|nr:hypothetical protein K438DRAFT_1954180 [Mycena galopus ATCC 62051]
MSHPKSKVAKADLSSSKEFGCLNYFATKNIPADNQVAVCLISLHDQKVINWLAANHARLCTLTFAAFMVDIRMRDTSSFKEWTTGVIAHAVLMNGTPNALMNEQLRHTFEAGMSELLRRKYGKSDNKIINDIDTDKLDD